MEVEIPKKYTVTIKWKPTKIIVKAYKPQDAKAIALNENIVADYEYIDVELKK